MKQAHHRQASSMKEVIWYGGEDKKKYPVLASTSVDALNPKGSHITLLCPSISVRIL